MGTEHYLEMLENTELLAAIQEEGKTIRPLLGL